MKKILILLTVLAFSLSINAQISTKLKIKQVLYSENGNTKLENVNMEGTLYLSSDKSKCIVTVDARTKVRAEGSFLKKTIWDTLPTYLYNATDHRDRNLLLSVAFNDNTGSTYIKFEYSNMFINYLCTSSF